MRPSALAFVLALPFLGGIFSAVSFAQSVSFTSTTNFGAGARPRSVAVGDFNKDGRRDLAVANQFSDNVSILLNGRRPWWSAAHRTKPNIERFGITSTCPLDLRGNRKRSNQRTPAGQHPNCAG